jgi:hypothetical protein
VDIKFFSPWVKFYCPGNAYFFEASSNIKTQSSLWDGTGEETGKGGTKLTCLLFAKLPINLLLPVLGSY